MNTNYGYYPWTTTSGAAYYRSGIVIASTCDWSDTAPTWTTSLWERNDRKDATARTNLLTWRYGFARGAKAKSRIDLEILRCADVVRRTTK